MLVAGNQNFEIEQGSTFAAVLKLRDKDGLAIDITGCSFKGQIREKISSPKVLVHLDFQISDPQNGEVSISLSHLKTAGLPARGISHSALTSLPYDIELEYPSGTVQRILQGFFKVSPEVTR